MGRERERDRGGREGRGSEDERDHSRNDSVYLLMATLNDVYTVHTTVHTVGELLLRSRAVNCRGTVTQEGTC